MRRGAILSLVALLSCSAGAPLPPPPPPPPAPPKVAVEPPPPDPCMAARAAVQKAPGWLAEGKLDRAVRSLRKAAARCPATAAPGRASLARALLRLGRAAEAQAVAAAIDADPRAGDEARAAAAEVREQAAKSVAPRVEQVEALLSAAADERRHGREAAAQELLDRALWAVEAGGEAVRVDAAAEGPFFFAAFGRDPRSLAVLGMDALAIVDPFGREHGRLARDWGPSHQGFSAQMTFAGADDAFVVARTDRGLEVVERAGLGLLRVLDRRCVDLAGAPREPWVACAVDGQVEIWDVAAGGRVHTLPGAPAGTPIRLRWSDDGQRITAVGADALVSWPASGKGRAVRRAAPRGWEHADAWLRPDGRTLAVVRRRAAEEGEPKVELHDVDTLAPRGPLAQAEAMKERRALGVPPPGVDEKGEWSPDRRYFRNPDGLWTPRGERLPRLARRGHAVLSAAFSRDGRVFGAGYTGGVFRSFDAATGRPRKTHVQPWDTRALAFRMEQGQYFARVATSPRTGWSADGRVEVKGHDRTLFVRDGKDDQVCEGEGGGGDIQAVAVSPDGREAVTLSPHEALLWDATRCAVIAPLPAVPGATPLAASYAPDGDAVGIAWSSGAVRLVTLATRTDREVASSAPSHDLHKLLFLSGGRAVAVADPLRVWDLESGAARPEVAPEGTALAVSPDGKLVISTAGDDGALRFTDARTGRLRVALRALDEGDSAYAIAPGDTPGDTRVEPLDAAAREALVCRAGPRAYPYELCAERAEVPGLFAAALRGEEP